MKYYVDLHIHSALSPCADDDMTPNNIVNMAMLKGLDIISVTDHNSAENLEAVIKCGKKTGILVIPGMEIETREEVHVVCFFPSLNSALKMQHEVYKALPSIKNRSDIFGNQLIFDEQDNVVSSLERMLITATNITIEEVNKKVKELGGVMVPAHVDRESYSILSNLGMIPEEFKFRYLEVSRFCNIKTFLQKYPNLSHYKFIISSDAHNLGSILERESEIELEEKSVSCFIEHLSCSL
ncbi:MAG TPA: PHP domain-containing protein [Clostridiaceae bacterium]|nr:PHP domain-containing protein [Clostridiaceae bacterium]